MVEQLCQKDETGSKYVAAILEYKFSHFRQYQPVPLISTYGDTKFEDSSSNGSKVIIKNRNRK